MGSVKRVSVCICVQYVWCVCMMCVLVIKEGDKGRLLKMRKQICEEDEKKFCTVIRYFYSNNIESLCD